jgi:hypothetical protein
VGQGESEEVMICAECNLPITAENEYRIAPYTGLKYHKTCYSFDKHNPKYGLKKRDEDDRNSSSESTSC